MGSSQTTGRASSHRFLKGAPLNAGAMIYAKAVSFLAGVILARVIGADQYGIFNVARNVLESCGIITPLGLNLALQRHLGAAPDRLSARLTQLSVFRSVTFGVALAPSVVAAMGLSAYVEEAIYRYPDFANILLVTLIALPFATDLAVLGGAYRGIFRPEPSVITSCVVQPTVRLLLIGVLFAFGLRLWAVVVGTSASYIIAWAVLALQARQDLAGTRTGCPQDWTDIWSVFGYSPSLGLSMVFSTWLGTADSLFLGYFGTPRDVGQYAAILMVVQLIGLVGEALGQTLGPRVALCFRQNDLVAMEKVLADNIRRGAILSAPIFAAILFWGDRIDLVLGPSFAVEFTVVAVVAARMFLQTLFRYSGFALSMTGWHLRETILLGSGFLMSLLLCWVLVPQYGQLGAALASFVALVAVDLIRYAIVRMTFGIKIVDTSVVLTTALAIVTTGLVYGLMSAFDNRTLTLTSLQVAISFALYAGMAWPLLFTNQDRVVLSSLVPMFFQARR